MIDRDNIDPSNSVSILEHQNNCCETKEITTSLSKIVTLLLALLTLRMSTWCGAELPHIKMFNTPEYGYSDQTVLNELEAIIANTKDEKRTDASIKFLTENYNRIESPSLRARLCISLSNLYTKQMDIGKAKNILRKAITEYADTDMGLLAGEKLLNILQEEGDYISASQLSADISNISSLTTIQDIHFSGRLGFFLVATGNINEALTVTQSLLIKYPEYEEYIGHACENVAVTAGGLEHRDKYYEGMQWISKNLESYSGTPRFLGNYAHACQENGKDKQALNLYLKLAEEFPEDDRIPNYWLEIANLFKEQGDMLAAYTFYRKVLNMETEDEYFNTLQKVAGKSIIYVERRLGIEAAKRLIEESINETVGLQDNSNDKMKASVAMYSVGSGNIPFSNESPNNTQNVNVSEKEDDYEEEVCDRIDLHEENGPQSCDVRPVGTEKRWWVMGSLLTVLLAILFIFYRRRSAL